MRKFGVVPTIQRMNRISFFLLEEVAGLQIILSLSSLLLFCVNHAACYKKIMLCTGSSLNLQPKIFDRSSRMTIIALSPTANMSYTRMNNINNWNS
jgi:hypothetical protein